MQYRYGFNGKENDNEVKGTGNQQDYGMRIYDPRIGKFLSVDPLASSYPFYTPYQFAGNMPIKYIDLDGLEPAENPQFAGQGAYASQKDADGNVCEGTDCYPWVSNDGSTWSAASFMVTNFELTNIFPTGNAGALRQIETSVNLQGNTFGINSKTSLAGNVHFSTWNWY